jgi:hypothetical protein
MTYRIFEYEKGLFMAQRGRPPKDEASRKSEPVSIRLTPDLRARLEAERRDADPERTLSQEIELRIRESFDFDKTKQQLLGGNDHYWLMRLLAEQIASIEFQTAHYFLDDKFTFDQVKTAIITVVDHFDPPGVSLAPECLTGLLDEEATTELGRRLALLALSQLELAQLRSDLQVLPDFVDPIAAGRRLGAYMQKSAIAELNDIWQRKNSAPKSATTKNRRKAK